VPNAVSRLSDFERARWGRAEEIYGVSRRFIFSRALLSDVTRRLGALYRMPNTASFSHSHDAFILIPRRLNYRALADFMPRKYISLA